NMSTDGVRARLCFYAWKSKEVFRIFKEVFGPGQRSRLKFVVSTQSVQTLLSCRCSSGACCRFQVR
ncbi:MAG: hypothetical protein ACK53Y_24625, partial [bacterium]